MPNAPIVITFSVEGFSEIKGIFDSLETRMIRFDQQTTRSSQRAGKERVTGTRTEVDQREKEYAQLVKTAARWEKEAVKDAEKAVEQKVSAEKDLAKQKERIRENSMRMAHRMLEQEVRDEAQAAAQKTRILAAQASTAARQETSIRRRYGRAMGRGALTGMGNFVGSATSLMGMGLSIGGGFAIADAVRKDMSFSRAVAQASNMSYIPGNTTRAEVSPAVIDAMSRKTQGLTNIDKEEVANGIKRYVGLSSDFRGLAGKTQSGKTGLEELAILSKASGTSFDTLMESAASIKAKNAGMDANGLIDTMRMMLGAGKQGSLPLDVLAPYVGTAQSTASIYAGSGTSAGLQQNQANLLGLTQLAGFETGGDAARAAMAVKDFAGDIAREGKKHEMTPSMIFAGGDDTQGFLAPQDLLANVFAATKGSYSRAQKILGKRSLPLFTGLQSTFQEAEAAKKGSGVEAVRAKVASFENFSYSSADTMKEFATTMASDGERIDRAFKHIEETVEGHVAPMLDKFASMLENKQASIDKFIDALAEVANFMISHPWESLFLAMEASILKSVAEAAIGQAVKNALVNTVGGNTPALGGKYGEGTLGSSAKSMGVAGALSAGLVIGSLAVTTATIGMAIIDKMGDDAAKADRERVARDLGVNNDLRGVKPIFDRAGNVIGASQMTPKEQKEALERDLAAGKGNLAQLTGKPTLGADLLMLLTNPAALARSNIKTEAEKTQATEQTALLSTIAQHLAKIAGGPGQGLPAGVPGLPGELPYRGLPSVDTTARTGASQASPSRSGHS